MNCHRCVLASALALALTPAWTAAPARADLITFSSRPAWETAVSGSILFTEDFQGFIADTQFRTATVDVGPFTLRQVGGGVQRNFIDVPPLEFADNNGTAHASLFTDFGTTTVAMTFRAPLNTWGADFFGAASGEGVSLDLIGPGGELLATLPVPVDTGFFGFVADPAVTIDQLVFRSRTNIAGAFGEGFGLDNVTGAQNTAVIPEPSAVVPGALGSACLLGYARRRRLTGSLRQGQSDMTDYSP